MHPGTPFSRHPTEPHTTERMTKHSPSEINISVESATRKPDLMKQSQVNCEETSTAGERERERGTRKIRIQEMKNK